MQESLSKTLFSKKCWEDNRSGKARDSETLQNMISSIIYTFPQLCENKILIYPILKRKTRLCAGVFFTWYQCSCSYICAPVNSIVSLPSAALTWTYTSARKEEPWAPGLVYDMTVLQRAARDVYIFNLNILQTLSLAFLGLFFPCLFRLNCIVNVWASHCSFAPPQTGSSLALKYKNSYWDFKKWKDLGRFCIIPAQGKC